MEEVLDDRQQHIPRIFPPILLRTPHRLVLVLLRSPLLELVFEVWLCIAHHPLTLIFH